MPFVVNDKPTPWYERVRDKDRLFLSLLVWLGEDYQDNANLPQIIVSPNPKSLNISARQVETKTTMYTGFYEECWGDGPGTISCAGQTQGFFLPQAGYVGDDARFETQSYKNYRLLCEVFKNNGVVYAADGSVYHQGDIILQYDKFYYYGRFTDFRTEFAKPYCYDINFTFEYRLRSI